MSLLSLGHTFDKVTRKFSNMHNNKIKFIRSIFTMTYSKKKQSYHRYNKLFSTFNNNNDDVFDHETTESTSQSKPLSFSYDCLPEETMFVIDGTSWLFNAYYR